MKKYLIALMMVLLPLSVQASVEGVHLDSIEVDLENKASLQRGMATFVNRCLGCHSADYQRYERAANDLDIPNELAEEYLLLGNQKIGEQMKIAMDKGDAANWFGNPPPDLSLEARLRGPDWIYTYLRSFYQDDSRPWGVNNVVFKDVGMPNVLQDLQGLQINHCTHEELAEAGEGKIDPLTNTRMSECLTVAEKGSQSVEEFDRTVYDLTNFLAYMGEPYRLESERIGTKVLIFLFIFFLFAYALKKEYWKDVH